MTVCPGFRAPRALGVLDDRDREAVLDRGERIEGLALDVDRRARGREAVDPDDRCVADRAEDAFVDHDETPSEKDEAVGYRFMKVLRSGFILAALVVSAAAPTLLAAPPDAGAPRTMRVDYFHTGNATAERFSLDRVVLEPLPWPGNPTQPIDTTNLGKYLFEVIDRATNRIALLARFRVGLRRVGDDGRGEGHLAGPSPSRCAFPAPEAPVQIVVKKRDPTERVPRDLDLHASTRKTSSSTRPRRPRRAPSSPSSKSGRARRRRSTS